MKNFLVVLVASLTFAVCSAALITINGQDALPFLETTPHGTWLKCVPRGAGGVKLRINKGAVEMASVAIDKIDAGIRAPLRFVAIQKDHECLSQFEKSRSFRDIANPSLLLKDREISEKYLEASVDMTLESVIFCSPEVTLAAKRLNFDNCFCGRDYLVIVSTNPDSWYKAIAFGFDEKCSFHTTISGKIDFVTDVGEFEAVGVKEINVIFTERAFE